MPHGDFQSYLRLLRGFFAEFQSVLREKTRPPPRLALHYQRAFLVVLCLYPNQRVAGNAIYRLANWLILCNAALVLGLVVYALHETNNTVDMGDDMVWIIGIGLVLTKITYYHLRADEIDEVIDDFSYYDRVFRSPSYISHHSEREEEEIERWKRICYLIESSMFINMTAMVSLFNLAICVQPLFDDKELPFHVVMPHDWHRAAQHPWSHSVIFVWLAFSSQLNLLAICNIDLLGVHSFLHTALNLKFLCIELSKLGNLRDDDALFHTQFCRIVQFHQHIIRTIRKNNRVFHGTFIAQMIASFAMVSMSTFEVMATLQDPRVAAKFVLFAVTTFVQLSYWCLAGTLVYSQSEEVAQAAFAINDWHIRSIGIQRNIMFMIKRCQKPLLYAAQPFPPFTLVTYSIILKQSYRALALLRESV